MSQLPDVNVEITRYGIVQNLLDQIAQLCCYAVPDPGHTENATLTPDDPDDFFGINGGAGLDLGSTLHPLESVIPPFSGAQGFAIDQGIGKATGTFRSRWLFAPDDFPWSPGTHPPATVSDPWKPQRFAMQEVEVAFGDKDGFRGYGMGLTFPVTEGGRPKLLGVGVGNVMEGFGKLAGLQGTFVCNGELSALGFRGNVTVRMVDPNARIRSERPIPAVTRIPGPEPLSSFIVMRGEKASPTTRTEYGPPEGDLVSLVTPAQIRSVEYRFSNRGHRGLRTRMVQRQVVANLDATVVLDLLAPPGTPERAISSTRNVYRFQDREGNDVGLITAENVMGFAFGLAHASVPKQPFMRYGGCGPITEGSGIFDGVRGTVAVNSAIGISPHALSMINVLQLVDPEGRFRV